MSHLESVKLITELNNVLSGEMVPSSAKIQHNNTGTVKDLIL